MKKIGAAFENFVFRPFDFNGRATLLEYWLIMPLVWGLIIFLAHGDLTEMWAMLLERKVPPLNPLYWDALLVFLLTFIPRMSLTVRRLHDSGKSGKWAKLPFIALFSGFILVLGLLSAMATSNVMAGGSQESGLGMAAIVMAIVYGSAESAWDVIFGAAAVANAMGWDAIFAVLAELTTPAQEINVSQGLANVANGVQNSPMEGGTMMIIMVLLITTPFVTAMLHLFFMISPTKPDHDLDSALPIAGASLRKQGEVSENPFAGYKYLYAKTPEQEAANKVAAQEEIKSLYQQRVLGRQPT
ncbi:MAG: DUF805 domain-containing protein [Sulfitobacter sp.]